MIFIGKLSAQTPFTYNTAMAVKRLRGDMCFLTSIKKTAGNIPADQVVSYMIIIFNPPSQ